MIHKQRYIEWRTANNNSIEAMVADAMRHYQYRYELGAGVFLSSDPATTVKQLEKQWRKLTRQQQQKRQTKSNAEDILSTTRTISRMQRVTFTDQSPSSNPDASLYVLPEDAEVFPVRCTTLYSARIITEQQVTLLPAETLVVSYAKKRATPGLLPKSQLEAARRDAQTALLHWLKKQHIQLDTIENDMEQANAALDTLLSSARTQNEFLHLTTQYLHAVAQAQPCDERPSDSIVHRATLHLEKQVKALTPGFLSDHIIDSTSDDSFLLRDNTGRPLVSFESMANFIQAQYQKGHVHLAKALEQTSGIVRA